MQGRVSIFTIGHSAHPLDIFVDYLIRLSIRYLIDCRSVPFSKRYPQFNQSVLEARLERANIAYVDEGRALGARPKDAALYENGRLSLKFLERTAEFQAALDRVIARAVHGRVALVCSEGDPLECPRFLLTARRLVDRGHAVSHVLTDGAVETHLETEVRLLRATKQDVPQLFESPEEALARAYEIQALRVAFEGPPTDHDLVD